MKVKQIAKIAAIVGGVAGAVAATLASGGTVGIAILAGVSAAATGVGALYVPVPGSAGKGQAGDAEDPK